MCVCVCREGRRGEGVEVSAREHEYVCACAGNVGKIKENVSELS